VERDHGGMLLENGMHDLALNTDTTAVDDANLVKALLDGLIQVFLDHNMNLFRLKGVEVDGILDWDVVHDESI
jgi:hypothetical protein